MSLRRTSSVAALTAALVLAIGAPARAQTLIPPLPGITQHDDKPPEQHAPRSHCYGPTLLCDPGALVGAAGDVVGAGVGLAADSVMGGVVGWAANGAAWLITTIAEQVDRSTRPALGSAWFARRYAAMRNLAISLALLFLLAAITHAVLRQDLAMLARSCLIALPLALLLTFAAVTLVELGLALTDSLTDAALRGLGGDVKNSFADLGHVLAPPAPTPNPLPGLVLFLGSILIAVLAIVVWIELVLREAAIYVAVAFLPLALAAVTWPRTAHWARRLAEWITAIVLSKLAIAVSFAVAGSMLGHARGGGGGLSAILGGCAVLLVAALSPWVLLRLIPFAEQAAGSLQRSHVGGAMRAAPGAAAGSLLVRQAMLKSFGAGLGAAPAAARSRQWTPPPRQPIERRPERAQ
jgi:hypothetical protein